MPPSSGPRRASPTSAKTGKDLSKKDQTSKQKNSAVSAADASLQDWGSLMHGTTTNNNKTGKGGHGADKDGQLGGGVGGGGGGGSGPDGSTNLHHHGRKGGNFVSLLDANALKSMKGKGKSKGKGGLFGGGGSGGGNEEANEKACAICAVTEGSVYPPYPRCEISMAALAAIAHYHLTKPKKKETKKRGGASGGSSGSPKKKKQMPTTTATTTDGAAGGGGGGAGGGRSPPSSPSLLPSPGTPTTGAEGKSTRAGRQSNSPNRNFESTLIETTKEQSQQQEENEQQQLPPSLPIQGELTVDVSIAAVPPDEALGHKSSKEDGDDDDDDEAADATVSTTRNSTAHVLYCLTCRCLYDDEQLRPGWLPHRFCQRCLYCTHGYRDVRVLDLSPGAPTVCKDDGLPVPQSYADVRAQADRGIHWVMPLSESDVLQGRPNLLPPEARDFKSAMNRRSANKQQDINNNNNNNNNNNINTNNNSMMEASGFHDDENNVASLSFPSAATMTTLSNTRKEFVYEDAFVQAVGDIIVANEEFRRKNLVESFHRQLGTDKLRTTEEFAVSFVSIAARFYISQIFLMQEKFKQETKKIRASWTEKVKNDIADLLQEADEIAEAVKQDQANEFQRDIAMQVVVSRSEMIKKFPSKEVFDLYHHEAMSRTAILRDEDQRRYIFWLTTESLPNFVLDSIQFQSDAVESCKAKQKELWKELNVARVEVGAEKLFDEFGFRQIVTYGTIARLRLQVEAEGDKIYEREFKEKAARVDLRYYFLRGKLQAVESEKRRSYASQRLTFLHMMLTVEEGEERKDVSQHCMREFSQVLTRLKRQAKSEGLFPDPKQANLEEVGLALSASKSASLFDKKGKLIIPTIPYKKPPAPVPASSNFIGDVMASLTRAFSGVDDVFITADGRVGVVAAAADPVGAQLARDRVVASFFPSETRDKKGGASLSVMRQSSGQRSMPFGVTYFDPDSPPPPEMAEDKIREAAANAIKKMRSRRRGGGKTQAYDADTVAKPLPIAMSFLEFLGEVGTSTGQLKVANTGNGTNNNNNNNNNHLFGSFGSAGSKGKRKFAGAARAVSLSKTYSGANTSNAASGRANSIAGSEGNANNDHQTQLGSRNSPTTNEHEEPEGSNEQSGNPSPVNLDETTRAATRDGHDDDEDDDDSQRTSHHHQQSAPGTPFHLLPSLASKQQQQSASFSMNSNIIAGVTNNINSSFRLASPRADAAAPPPSLSNNFSFTSNPLSQTFSATMTANLLPHQRLDFVDRSILSSNVVGRPVASLFDDEANHLFFLHSVKREDDAYAKALRDTQDLLRQATDRICVAPAPRHKRERKPAWVEQRAMDIFNSAEIPALPPPPPPPPKPKPKPKSASDATAKGGARGRSAKDQDGSGGEGGSGRKRKVTFTDADGAEGLEFPEGQDESSANSAKAKPKPKRTAPKADPALLAAMSASQSQREMMRAMSMAAAGENGADMEGAAFAMGHHDGNDDERAGSAFSLLLAKALDGGKKKKGGASKGGSNSKKKPGRHYDYM